MKEILHTSEYRRGPRLDELRRWHLDFIEEHLVFKQELEIDSTKVSECYGKWREVRNWSSGDVRNLYIRLVKKHGVRIRGNTLIGVGLRD